MGNNVNKMVKALMPMLNQRLKDLEHGRAIPGIPGTISASNLPAFFSDPNYTGGLGLAAYNRPAQVNPKGPDYNNLSQGTRALLQSVSTLKAQTPDQHHQSIFSSILNTAEKGYHAVTGAISEQGKTVDDPKFKNESIWDRIAHNAEAIGHGAREGWDNKKKVNYSDLQAQFAKDKSPLPSFLDVGKQDEFAKSKVGKIATGFVGDVALDPLTYTGVGGFTKVKNLAKTAEDLKKVQDTADALVSVGHANPGEVEHIFLNPDNATEGKWFARKSLPNTAQRAGVMKEAKNMAEAFGHESYTKTLSTNHSVARTLLKGKGIEKFTNLVDFQKKVPGATVKDLAQWNHDVDVEANKLAHRLTGSRMDHVAQKSEELLSIASRNNLAGDAAQVRSQLDKALGLKFAGKRIATVKLPEKLRDTSSALANAHALKGVKEFVDAAHDHFDTAFRTGSHLDPLINTLRMGRNASIVEKTNQYLRSMNNVWGGIDRATRSDIAHSTVNGLTHNVIPGGKDLITQQPVHDLVAHSTEIVNHIQDLVAKGHITFHEFNRTLPAQYKIDPKLANSPDWLMRAWKEKFLDPNAEPFIKKVGNDPNVFLNLMNKAAYSAMTDREFSAQVIARFGHKLHDTVIDPKTGNPIRRTGAKDDPITRLLVDRHGYRTPLTDASKLGKPGAKYIPEYHGHVFQEDVARSIEAMHRMIHGDAQYNRVGMHAATRLFNDATSLIKTIVTKYNPGFHERNLMGEMASSLGDGVVSIKPYRTAAKVLMLRGRRELATGAEGSFRVANAVNPDAYHLAKLGQHIKGTDVILRKHFIGLGTTGVTADQLWHAYVESGLKSGWIATDTGKYAGRMALGKTGIKLSNAAQHGTEFIEDYTRLAHFVSRLQRSKLKNFDDAVEEAAGYVRKFHFDYNDFTHFEKNIASKIIPFYKWTRKNIPLQMSLLFQRPGYFLAQMKALNAISNARGYNNQGMQIPPAEAVMPQWLKDHLAVPVGMGNQGERYLDAPLPTTDAFKFFGAGPGDTARSAEYMLNPMIKMPIELGTGHQIGGAPIKKKQYFSATTPYTNLLNNLRNPSNTGKRTNMYQFLLGLGLVENTPARIKSELKQEQSQYSAARKKFRKKQNLAPLGYTAP